MLNHSARKILKRARPGAERSRYSSSWSPGTITRSYRSPASRHTRPLSVWSNDLPYHTFPESNSHSLSNNSSRYLSSSTYSGARQSESFGDYLAALPKDAQLQFDFFGEPITFLGLRSESDHTSNAMAALDGFLLAVTSKGRTCIGGGTEQGLEMKSAHASAIAWAELLRHAKVWNVAEKDDDDDDAEDNDKKDQDPEEIDAQSPNTSKKKAKDDAPFNKFAPMLAVTAIAPVMAQAGPGYVAFLDKLLKHGDSLVPGMGPLQMMPLADAAVKRKDDRALNERERDHIQALEHMMKYDHATALSVYLRILRKCPGDILALSLAMDLASMLGDKEAALRAATSISSYWNERQGGYITPSIPGYNIACAWQAVGLAVGGRKEEAEQIAERTLSKDKRNSGAITTWALAHLFDSEGRVSEGISYLANADGIANYEGAGMLFFDCRLSCYGSLFSIDREQRGRGRSMALRLYDRNFERVLEYSGFSHGKAWTRPQRKAPIAWTQRANDGENSKTVNFFKNLLGVGSKKKEQKKLDNNTETQIIVKETLPPSLDFDAWDPSCEDVLTWLPPTPPLLTEATLLMFRLTLNGTLSTKDYRWDSLRNSWNTLLRLQKDEHGNLHSLEHFPLASLAASILIPVEDTGGDQIGNGRMAVGLNLLGEMLNLGNLTVEKEDDDKDTDLIIADIEPDFWLPAKDDLREEWKEIVKHLEYALDGIESHGNADDEKANRTLRFESWDFLSRPVVEHAICYAACRAGDIESLSYARAISSQGVTLRRMSPEEWWRYSIILGLLGDQIASENALAMAVNIGSGQGQRG